jgi:hypothetical protein
MAKPMTDDLNVDSGKSGSGQGDKRRWLPKQVISGEDEGIFLVLPESVLTNFLNPTSENALLWNVIYPLAQPTIALTDLLNIRPLWGNPNEGNTTDDALIPYYWGYDVDGERLSAARASQKAAARRCTSQLEMTGRPAAIGKSKNLASQAI